MIWLTWRQHRRTALIFGGAIALLVTFFVVTGLVTHQAYEQVVGGLSVATCQRQMSPSSACDALSLTFVQTYYRLSQYGMLALVILPALAGMFLGAPLVARELESGTFRLIWTQSVTRRRWLGVSCAVVIGVVVLMCAIFIPLVRWWGAPLGLNIGLGGEYYDFGGATPVVYLFFALALGIAAGALLRRVVPAMFATLVGYIAVRLPIEVWARPHFLPPLTQTWDPLVSNGPTNITVYDWILYDGFASKAGQPIDPAFTIYQTCAPTGEVNLIPGSVFTACVHAHGWLSTMIWQPASRYWLFQGIESAIFVALAAALLALAFWWVRRRIA